MANYAALQAKWATLPVGTTQSKLDNLNAQTVVGAAQRVIVAPSDILNSVVPADIASMPQIDILRLSMLLSGATVDASAGTTVRAGIQAIFAGKTQTLANLAALAAKYDSPQIPWWQANGFEQPIGTADLTLAGGLT